MQFGLESFDLEAIRLRAHDRGALDRLMAEMHCWSQMLLSFSEWALFNRARKILSNQYDCINQTQKLC